MTKTQLLTKLKSPAFILAVLGSIKLIANALGFDIPDAILNETVNIASFILTLVGIYVDHGGFKDVLAQILAEIKQLGGNSTPVDVTPVDPVVPTPVPVPQPEPVQPVVDPQPVVPAPTEQK